MKKRLLTLVGGGLTAGVISVGTLRAQSLPTATQALEISVFGAGTGTYTELGGGRNGAITAGADVMWRNYFHVRPGLEVRGTYPFRRGQVDGQESFLVGPRFQKVYGRYMPYVDGFYGRGSISYERGGIVIGNYRYDRTTSNIFAVGGGLDFRVTRQFDAKADIQFERWHTPVTDTGTIFPIPLTFGIVYRFDFNHHYSGRSRRSRRRDQVQDTGVVGSSVSAPTP